MVAEDQNRVVIEALEPFAGTGGAGAAALAARAVALPVRRRQVVYLPGDPGADVYWVATGRVKLSKVTRDGKELNLAYCGPGEIFGELCLVDGGPREEMATAADAGLVIRVPRQDLEKLVARQPAFGERLAHIALSRRRELERKIEKLVFRDVSSKLAELLLALADEHGVADDRGTRVEVRITHQEMANIIGATRETVSVTLAGFKRRGLVAIDGRRVILADRDGLRALA